MTYNANNDVTIHWQEMGPFLASVLLPHFINTENYTRKITEQCIGEKWALVRIGCMPVAPRSSIPFFFYCETQTCS